MLFLMSSSSRPSFGVTLRLGLAGGEAITVLVVTSELASAVVGIWKWVVATLIVGIFVGAIFWVAVVLGISVAAGDTVCIGCVVSSFANTVAEETSVTVVSIIAELLLLGVRRTDEVDIGVGSTAGDVNGNGFKVAVVSFVGIFVVGTLCATCPAL